MHNIIDENCVINVAWLLHTSVLRHGWKCRISVRLHHVSAKVANIFLKFMERECRYRPAGRRSVPAVIAYRSVVIKNKDKESYLVFTTFVG